MLERIQMAETEQTAILAREAEAADIAVASARASANTSTFRAEAENAEGVEEGITQS